MNNNANNKKTDLEIIFEKHPELESKMLNFINGKEFDSLYNEYFKKKITNCMDACIKKMGKEVIYIFTADILKRLKSNSFRDFAETLVLRTIVSHNRTRCMINHTDLYESLDDFFSNSIDSKSFKEYIISILQEGAKYIGTNYINMYLDYLNVSLTDSNPNYDYDYSDDLEPS